MISTEQIESTNVYQNLTSAFEKSLATNKHQREKINHGVNVVRNIGLDKWKNDFHPSPIVAKIVKELSTSNN